MKTKIAIALVLAAIVLVVAIAVRPPATTAANPEAPAPAASIALDNSTPESAAPEPLPVTQVVTPFPPQVPVAPQLAESPAAATNKLERLSQTRETFRKLAAGDRTTALRAAKQVTDETERETALLTLVTEWTQGELSSPRTRARLIDAYGLEAGLGFELTKNPELALLWANEMTEGAARVDLLQQIARDRMATDPAAAFALSQQVPEDSRRKFADALYFEWAATDTAAAMVWAERLTDPAERAAAIAAIRSVAPVGIGAALKIEGGYPVIEELIPGTPAELSRQINPGDRIVALAEGNSAFVDAHGVELAEIVNMVRGAPGTVLKLQVVSANAPPNSPPRTVLIVRDQIKFKR